MAKPEATDAALELYEALGPFAQGDEERDWPLLKLCMAITSGAFDDVHQLVTDQSDTRPGWQVLFDPVRCPAAFLPWLAQVAGATLLPSMSEAEQREAIKDPEVFGRGTPAAIEAVAARHLTGAKSVLITERYTGDPWRLLIETLAEETPDEAALRQAILDQQKPIGVLLFLNQRVAWT